MKFSVVTASYNQFPWLKRCIRSVADQTGVEIEQVIQDGGSEGIEAFYPPDTNQAASYKIRIVVEKDTGMYDALNRGLEKTDGDVISILNCDEQYLPGTLPMVAELFEKNPETDMIVGDYLLVDSAGDLLSFRRATKLRPAMILSDHLYDFTCAMFFRRRVIDRGIRFNPAFRAAGDAEWIARLLQSGVRVKYCRAYLAVFAVTGDNLSLKADPAGESEQLLKITPRWATLTAPLLRQLRHIEKLLAGGYCSGPLSYEIYAGENEQRRSRFICEKPDFRHPWNRSRF